MNTLSTYHATRCLYLANFIANFIDVFELLFHNNQYNDDVRLLQAITWTKIDFDIHLNAVSQKICKIYCQIPNLKLFCKTFLQFSVTTGSR